MIDLELKTQIKLSSKFEMLLMQTKDCLDDDEFELMTLFTHFTSAVNHF